MEEEQEDIDEGGNNSEINLTMAKIGIVPNYYKDPFYLLSSLLFL